MIGKTHKPLASALAIAVVVLAADVMADGTIDLTFWTTSSGGDVVSGGGLDLTGTVGKPVTGVASGGQLQLRSGFIHEGTVAVDVENGDGSQVPAVSGLKAPYPNPFNPATNVSFEMAAAGFVTVRIFDSRGQLVRNLVREEMPAGRHVVLWDGKTDRGSGAPSGVYFLRFEAGGIADTKKMTLLK